MWLVRNAQKAWLNSCRKIVPASWVSVSRKEPGRTTSVIGNFFVAGQILVEKKKFRQVCRKLCQIFETSLFPNRKYIVKFNTGEPLSCFDYRAWGEGQPSHRGCVSLVNPSGESSPPFWKVVPCYVSLPFICEISPLSQRSSQNHNKSRHRT